MFLACLPLIEADLPAVLALDQRCLGGLWTRSGYQREIESDCSDLLVLVGTSNAEALKARKQLPVANMHPADFAASVPGEDNGKDSITLLGLGCLWAILEEAHITTLAIDTQYQGQKLGLWLLSELLLCALARDLTRATLEVRVSNQKALKLYQKFDFKEAGQRKKYYSDGESARILWRGDLQTKDCRRQIQQRRESALKALSITARYTCLKNIT